jgi:hypothetical protein
MKKISLFYFLNKKKYIMKIFIHHNIMNINLHNNLQYYFLDQSLDESFYQIGKLISKYD